MQIKNHLLFGNDGKQVDFLPTPNKGNRYTPKFLVLHYTAATTAKSAINWLLQPAAQASAHLVIDRDGSITQLAPFNVITWHAGKSRWGGLEGLNKYTIGIELVNGGRLSKIGEKCICPADKKHIADDDIVIATHKNESREAIWQEYTDKQMDVALAVSALLVKNYQLQDVLGHEDISPLRKSDPGPAFPMKSFRSKALGRKNEHQDEYVTSAKVNIRSGAGTIFSLLTEEPLPAQTHVTVLKTEGNWSFVEVLDTVNGLMDLEGWVFSKFLVKEEGE
jgi:N-acetylmuramoyl-L-alanine amidase